LHAGQLRLEIGFEDGSAIKLDERDEDGLDGSHIKRIASYVAERGGIPVAYESP